MTLPEDSPERGRDFHANLLGLKTVEIPRPGELALQTTSPFPSSVTASPRDESSRTPLPTKNLNSV